MEKYSTQCCLTETIFVVLTLLIYHLALNCLLGIALKLFTALFTENYLY